MVIAVYPWLKEVPVEERKQLSEHVSGLMVMERLYNAGYRKQEDILHEWVERETAYLEEIAELKKYVSALVDELIRCRKTIKAMEED